MKFDRKLHLPYSGQLVHTDVSVTIRKELDRLEVIRVAKEAKRKERREKRLAKLEARKNVLQIVDKRRKA